MDHYYSQYELFTFYNVSNPSETIPKIVCLLFKEFKGLFVNIKEYFKKVSFE